MTAVWPGLDCPGGGGEREESSRPRSVPEVGGRSSRSLPRALGSKDWGRDPPCSDRRTSAWPGCVRALGWGAHGGLRRPNPAPPGPGPERLSYCGGGGWSAPRDGGRAVAVRQCRVSCGGTRQACTAPACLGQRTRPQGHVTWQGAEARGGWPRGPPDSWPAGLSQFPPPEALGGRPGAQRSRAAPSGGSPLRFLLLLRSRSPPSSSTPTTGSSTTLAGPSPPWPGLGGPAREILLT